MSVSASIRPETILFVGAGATASLSMPTSEAQANILWRFCDAELTSGAVEDAAKCFAGQGQKVVDLLHVLDPGWDGGADCGLDEELSERAFPGIDPRQVTKVVSELRSHYDWSALKLIAKSKKGTGDSANSARSNYLQEVFTLIDANLREERGVCAFIPDSGEPVFLSVARLRAARELLVHLINTMFACAWQKLIDTEDGRGKVKRYQQFFDSLAEVMQDEGVRIADAGAHLDEAVFYKFSYSLVTTNFEPIFLWLLWQGHLHVNHTTDCRVGNPGRHLALRMNFPSTVGMRAPADSREDELRAHVWLPCTDAAAQVINSEKHSADRAFRLGMYSPVHGMTTFRHCPVCGRLNLYLGDTWEEYTETLFPNGLTHDFCWGQKPRTTQECKARTDGRYDALECHFCGALTYSYDNFMFMQTQLKSAAPSFIKEITDDALSQIAGARHVVLLGYSLPLDDAIWGSMLTIMSRRKSGAKVYCSVVATYDENGPDGWICGNALRKYVEDIEKLSDETSQGRWCFERIRAIKNAIAVFGEDNVRAYVKGIPNVFGDGGKQTVFDLMYPNVPEWDIPEFSSIGVVRTV